jgi:anti-anti-sigma factor
VRLQYETARIDPDITVVRLIGRLVTRLEGRALEVLVRELVSRGQQKIVLDLCGIDEFGNMACRCLVHCSSTVREAGGELCLATANPKVARLCRISRLDTMLPFYRTVAAASRFELSKGV